MSLLSRMGAVDFVKHNVVASGTHNNVPAYLAGTKPRPERKAQCSTEAALTAPPTHPGKTYAELRAFGARAGGGVGGEGGHGGGMDGGDEWLFDVAKRNGYATAFIDGEAVSSKSSLPRVRLKTFGDEGASRIEEARRLAGAFADHSLAAVFDEVGNFTHSTHLPPPPLLAQRPSRAIPEPCTYHPFDPKP